MALRYPYDQHGAYDAASRFFAKAETGSAGVSKYSIFRRDELLFLSMKVEHDFDTTWRKIESDPINTRWQQAMTAYFAPMPETDPGERFPMIREVFYMP